ncbi:MAG: cupin domain-containing protein [Promethearchaeota archaeon]
MIRNVMSKDNIRAIKSFDGVYRKTLLYNDNIMLCHFTLEKDAEIPIHSHKEHQIGYVLKGKLKFLIEDGEFLANEGESYIFDSNEKHGAKILEDSEVIDVFHPARDDYK